MAKLGIGVLGVGLLDLKFGGGLPGAVRSNIGDRKQASFRHKTPQIFCVAPAHLSHTEYSDTEFGHRSPAIS